MMINGFTPRMSLLSPSLNNQRLISPAAAMLTPLPGGLGNMNTNAGGFSTPAVPAWGLGSWLSPMMGNVISGASGFGSQLFGGLGNGFSGVGSSLGQMGAVGLQSLSSLNGLFAPQQPSVAPAFGLQPFQQQPVFQRLTNGAGQALKDLGNVVKNNAPAALAMGGAMVGGGAVCAFMGGAMAATGGIMLGNHAMQASNHPV